MVSLLLTLFSGIFYNKFVINSLNLSLLIAEVLLETDFKWSRFLKTVAVKYGK